MMPRGEVGTWIFLGLGTQRLDCSPASLAGGPRAAECRVAPTLPGRRFCCRLVLGPQDRRCRTTCLRPFQGWGLKLGRPAATTARARMVTGGRRRAPILLNPPAATAGAVIAWIVVAAGALRWWPWEPSLRRPALAAPKKRNLKKGSPCAWGRASARCLTRKPGGLAWFTSGRLRRAAATRCIRPVLDLAASGLSLGAASLLASWLLLALIAVPRGKAQGARSGSDRPGIPPTPATEPKPRDHSRPALARLAPLSRFNPPG